MCHAVSFKHLIHSSGWLWHDRLWVYLVPWCRGIGSGAGSVFITQHLWGFILPWGKKVCLDKRHAFAALLSILMTQYPWAPPIANMSLLSVILKYFKSLDLLKNKEHPHCHNYLCFWFFMFKLQRFIFKVEMLFYFILT